MSSSVWCIFNHGNSKLYLTDPSGTYIEYDAIAIGSDSNQVMKFLEDNYNSDITSDDAAVIAAAGIYISSEDKEKSTHIRMAQIHTDSGKFEIIPDSKVAEFAKSAREKFKPQS